MVETSEAIPGKRIYTAIDSDFSDLHFKCYEKSDDPNNPSEKVVQYCCNTSWKQRVGVLSSTVTSEESIAEITKRLEKYIKSLGDENLRASMTLRRVQDAV